MAMPNALVKCSGSLLDSWEVIHFLHCKQRQYALRVVCGGGEQINQVFRDKGWPIDFGPFGRICEGFEQRLAAENVLKINAAALEDRLHESDVRAQIITPVLDKEVGGVTCHVNGDLMPILCYNGFDKIYVCTKTTEAQRKKRFYAAVWKIMRAHLDTRDVPDSLTFDFDDFPPNLEVVGFD